jgi:sugar (pentulose or hexulose) kinase
MAIFIGVDVGSSSIKGATLDTEKGSLGPVRSRPFPDPRPSSSTLNFEIDAALVVDSVRSVIHELIELNGRCDGIVLCAQMGGLIFVGSKGEILSPYYSWRDQRTVEPHPSGHGSYFDVYASRLSEADFAAVGRELRAGSTAALLFWLAERKLLPSGPATPVTLVDAVVANLCGSACATDPTEALGMMNLETRDWHAPLYNAAAAGKCPRSKLQPFTQSCGVFRCGSLEIPCYPAVGDQQAALRGVGLREGELSINSSTGSQVSLVTSTLQLGDYQTRPFFGTDYLNTVTHLPAGRSLNVLMDLLQELPKAEGLALRDSWDYVAKKAAEAPPEELDVDLAFFAGPLGDRGEITNIRTDNLTVGSVFRAAFRAMAENYKVCARRLSASEDWNAVLLSGGLPQKIRVLRDMIAGKFTAPCRDSRESEETLMGLLSMAREIETGAK